ncbi:AAA family ATPase [Xanthomarina sp. F2636L]|uniref:AAA family ATPase n=1 Tax=Xanthomarina sp. F2636L TaxID=2996018 RepID=UPI00225DFC3D|nr:AAA family ATPase [Xanthomarina sp. F2636L]MCX7552114.1 AAA family ATPase [Xanthomarina sp. F2636L]
MGKKKLIKQENLDAINDNIDKHQKETEKQENNTSCFLVKTANQWIDEAKLSPIPKLLFDKFLFEGEVCVLFADTNVGKSILAVQIADSISRGKAIKGFEIETNPQKVAYFDFELSNKQFEKRYSNNYKDHYDFHKNLLRVEINTEAEMPKKFKDYEDYLRNSFELVIEEYGAKVLIIDNITYLKSDNERAKDALVLMKHLKSINKKHGVSILVLAHTPKRDATKPITKNDLSGSKMLMNFCDSAFAIGESASMPSIRYIKQIKQRNSEQVFHSENVAVCKIGNPNNFLKFQFEGFGSESEHLKQYTASDLSERDDQIMDMKEEGLPNTQIASRLGVSEGTVRNTIKRLAA